ncbi:MAG: sulfatase-like hydrolase/transferase [Verrucomicrobiales bacterium]|nr:sulfatase-like hydrolase/transferase [Verrucomicrobiales bacterium]
MRTPLSLCLCLGFFPGLFLAAADTPARPNVILVMSDDQGWGDIGYNGHPLLQTPNLDAAAAAGLRLDSFYAAAPSCSPTRASVLTGRHPNRMGVFSWGHAIRPQELTLAEVLREEGYMTGHFGKWHLGSVRVDSPVSPGKNGFDRWVSAKNFYDNNPTLSDEGMDIKLIGEGSQVAVESALEWIREASRGEAPFLAVVWFGSPHYPHRASEEDAALYQDQPRNVRDFLGEVTGIDRAFGQLREGISDLGLRENTLLWFTSDNGALRKVGSTGGYRGGKHSVYEGGIRVPAFIEWPRRIPVPFSSQVRASTVDIFPTVLEAAGVSLEGLPPLDGISLIPAMDRKMQERPTSIGFWNAHVPGKFDEPGKIISRLLPTNQDWSDSKVDRVTKRVERLPRKERPLDAFPGHSAWISGTWKLHRREMQVVGRVSWELYDLNADPAEKHDLAKAFPARVAAMRLELEDWLREVTRSLNGEDYR